jgi:uncharacterized protein involved in exopolysaccharide biosynthesis
MAEEKFEIEKITPPTDTILMRRGSYGNGYYLDGYGEAYEENTTEEGTKILSDIWRAIRKRKFLILTITLLITLITAVEMLRLRPNYLASATVEVRKDSFIFSASPADSDPENTISINTRTLMLYSRPLLEEVVTKLELDKNPKFLDTAQKHSYSLTLNKIWNRIQGKTEIQVENNNQAILASTEDDDNKLTSRHSLINSEKQKSKQRQNGDEVFEENPRLDRYVAILERGLSVDQLKNTQALRISFIHTDPKTATIVANGLLSSAIFK